ncbi:transglycosylase domain-containing protein [Acetivibrio clariflavus]|uniref:transglycosylase domain-containing protein n=1 Tax=Acetivibrio clariflavus TaxID=288965 RepID=UPI000486496B|nr:PBP1A family penicillin-binding protein [Acetivibrio clariflavus]
MSSNNTAVSNTKTGKKKQQISLIRVIGNLIKVLILFAFTIGVIFAGIVGGAVFAYIKTAEPITADQLAIKNQTTYVYDCNNKEICALQGIENREMVDFSDIPRYLRDAFVAIEDKRFYQHSGVDFKRFASAVINFILPGGESHGGSTITQQVVKNVTGETRRSIKRKVQEAWRAILLERNLTKDQILEIYMNLIYMGENCYGVQSAAKTYFGKDVKDLTLAECASLAGITNLPAKYNPFTAKGRENNIKRQRIILNEMLELNFITQQEYDEAIKQELVFAESNKRNDKATSTQPYFVDQVILDVKRDLMAIGYTEDMAIKTIYNNGLRIYTTMDSDIQKAMDEVFLNEEYFTKVNKNTSQSPQAAMVIIDPKNGQIKAMYGGAGEKIGIPFNRATSLEKQPGSTIKPIAVYGPAINEGIITAATVIDDVPVYMNGASKGLYPKNSDGSYAGLTTIRDAITRSVNVVAAKIWNNYLGADLSHEYLKKVNINRDNERTVALSLGGLSKGVSPLQMAAAYVPFVNKGIYYEPTTYTRVEDANGNVILEKKPNFNIVYDEAAAFIMVNMLKDVVNSPDGTASRVKIQNGRMPTAGKTGTTDKNTNKWFVGFTPYYVGATWYGYDRNVSLSSAELNRAQTIWHAVMDKIHKNLEPVDFEVPSGVVKRTICKYSGKIATELCHKDPRGNAVKTEYFIKGTEPGEEDTCDVHVLAKVCKDSTDTFGRNLLAGDYCPHESTMEQVFVKRRKPFTPTNPGDPYPKDWKYEYPGDEYCSLHGPRDFEHPHSPNNNSNGNPFFDWFNDLFR